MSRGGPPRSCSAHSVAVITSIDGRAELAPDEPSPQPIGDAAYGFCYPEMARASRSFGAAFVGEVEGAQSLFLALLPD